MQARGSRQYIHYDPERIDFAVTGEELANLERASGSLWKDVCLVSFSLGIPCLINAIAGTKQPLELTLALFLNYLFGILGIAFGVIFGIAWVRNRQTVSSVIDAIKKKPKMEIAIPEAVNVGSLPTASLAPSNPEEPSSSE